MDLQGVVEEWKQVFKLYNYRIQKMLKTKKLPFVRLL